MMDIKKVCLQKTEANKAKLKAMSLEANPEGMETIVGLQEVPNVEAAGESKHWRTNLGTNDWP
jgi:hypothetical protein